ncbi:MAG: MarR family transcriptional regulator [Devosia sp.]|uniref:MarR family winged helix-turn-helix transcriptional regulator n=1 Tax=Devosia sp. TaxID=1871048 RepID=UPI002604B3CB|nr:MarR family winged helix-turn-helix transcriptional regulator [Devosia sp.]MDB5588104.1 MarR family transcriptional regulator [Devosia sp.]
MDQTCLCIAVRKASRRMTTVYDDALAPVGINLAQYSLLKKIRRMAPVSLTDLGAAMDLDRSTIGRNVKVLDRMGLTQAITGKDHREATVELSETGQGVLTTAIPLWERAQEQINTRLGADKVAQLEQLLAEL